MPQIRLTALSFTVRWVEQTMNGLRQLEHALHALTELLFSFTQLSESASSWKMKRYRQSIWQKFMGVLTCGVVLVDSVTLFGPRDHSRRLLETVADAVRYSCHWRSCIRKISYSIYFFTVVPYNWFLIIFRSLFLFWISYTVKYRLRFEHVKINLLKTKHPPSVGAYVTNLR